MSRTTVVILILALVFVALELGTALIEPYGLLHDELYYWACSRRPALGYVDHPPFAPWLLAVSTGLFGDELLGFGLVPAVCGAGTLLLTSLMARRLGAGNFGQITSGLCVIVAPLYMAFFSFYSVNALEILFWTVACHLIIEIIRTNDERLWLGFGVLAGIALLNKHTFLLLGIGLGAGVVATPLRAQLRSPWLWLGAAAAVLLALPNLVWNAAHGWPSLAFYRSVGAQKNIPTSLSDALSFQLFGMNPAAALIWVPGLFFLLFSRGARRYRPLGVAFLVLLVIMLFSGQRRGDRIAGAYPVAFAAGAAFWDRWARRPWQTRIRWTLPASLLGAGLLVAPAALPILSPQAVASYFEAFGRSPEIEPGDSGHEIPEQLLGRLEWERLAGEVFAAWETLPREDRDRAVVLASNWLYASAVEFYGRDRGIPPVVSPQNAYYFWRHESAGRDVAVSIGIGHAVLNRYFAETRPAGVFRCEYCANWRGNVRIFISHGPTRPIEELLQKWHYFGSWPSPQARP